MNMKDVIGVALASLLLFPIVLLVVMFATGSAHIQLGMDKRVQKGVAEYLKEYSPKQDSSDAVQSSVFRANRKKELDLNRREDNVARQIERLENLKMENLKIRESIEKDRSVIESAVSKSDELSEKRLKRLAQVYGSMKPAEAAPILLSLKNKDIAKIISLMSEVRSQAKLMAALGSTDRLRAAKITGILGWKKEKTRKVLGTPAAI